MEILSKEIQLQGLQLLKQTLETLVELEKHVFDSKLEEGNVANPSLDSTEDDDDFYKTRVITPLRDNDY